MKKYVPIKLHIANQLDYFLQGEIENEADFVEDYLRFLFDFELDNLSQNYHSPEDESIIIQKTNAFLDTKEFIIRERLRNEIEEIKGNISFLPSPIVMSLLSKKRFEVLEKPKKHISSLKWYYNDQLYFIDTTLAQTKLDFISEIKAKNSVTVLDAIGSYIVSPRNVARNIASHASMFDDFSKSHSAEIILDKCMFEIDGTYGLPHLEIDKFGKLKIDVIPSDDLRKELLSLLLVKKEIDVSYRLEHQSIKNEEFVIDKIYLLLNYYNPEIRVRDVYVFLHTLKKDMFDAFDYGEATYVRQKINDTLTKQKFHIDFLYLLYWLKIKNYIYNADNVSKSMGCYFINGTKMKAKTISNYLYGNSAWEFKEEECKDRVMKICSL
jgi:hypothetical protein